MLSHDRPDTEDEPSAKRSRSASPQDSDQNDGITEVNKDYQSEDADMTLISSDGIKFKVHRWALIASSKVFRDMLTVGDDDSPVKVELTDENIERGEVIQTYLDIVYSRSTCKLPLADESCDGVLALVKLLQKYEATYPLEILKFSLESWTTNNKVDNLDMFILGAQLDSPPICIAAINSKRDCHWTEAVSDIDIDNIEAAVTGAISDKNVLDLTAAPLSFMKLIPDRYKHALLNASAVVSGNNQNLWDSERESGSRQWMKTKREVAKEFKRVYDMDLK